MVVVKGRGGRGGGWIGGGKWRRRGSGGREWRGRVRHEGAWWVVYGSGGGGASIHVDACAGELLFALALYSLRRADVDKTKVRKPIE